MFTKPLEDCLDLPFIQLSFHFVKRKVDDVVVMNFFARQFVAELKPELVK